MIVSSHRRSALTNAPATMALWGGRTPFLGTNPFAMGVPAGSERPIVVDMATSVAARGKIILAAKKGEAIPSGLAVLPGEAEQKNGGEKQRRGKEHQRAPPPVRLHGSEVHAPEQRAKACRAHQVAQPEHQAGKDLAPQPAR